MSQRIYYCLDGSPSFFDEDFSSVHHRLDAACAQYWLVCADADSFDDAGTLEAGETMRGFGQAAGSFVDYGVATHPEVNTEVVTDDGVHWSLGGWPDVLEDFLSYLEDAGFEMVPGDGDFEQAAVQW